MRQYDLATACRWLGNSPVVAAKQDATSTDLDADFRRAAGLEPTQTQQNAQQTPPDAARQDLTHLFEPHSQDTVNARLVSPICQYGS